MAGTSQATPAVTGCVAILRGAFRAQQSKTPTGALLKALIVHGAVDLVGTQFTVVSRRSSGSQSSQQYQMTPAPNPFQGFGLVDINNSLAVVIGPITGQRGFVDGSPRFRASAKDLHIDNSKLREESHRHSSLHRLCLEHISKTRSRRQ